jgi:hypothetical protein
MNDVGSSAIVRRGEFVTSKWALTERSNPNISPDHFK